MIQENTEAPKGPQFDPKKSFSVVYSLDPKNKVAKIQFGAQFDAHDNFVGYIEGYDPKRHKEPKKRRTRKSTSAKRRTYAEGVAGKETAAEKRANRRNAEEIEALAAEESAAEHSRSDG